MKLSYQKLTFDVPMRTMLWLKSRMKYVRAAGGIVADADGQRLLITRRGLADLPKGMVEEGETLRQAALREVEEETGLRVETTAALPRPLKTYHIYNRYGGWHLKQTTWFAMRPTADGTPLKPQTDEEISEAQWLPTDQWRSRLGRSFGTLRTLARLVPIVLLLAFAPSALAQHPWEYSLPERYAVSEVYLVEPPTAVKQGLGLKTAIPYNCRYHVVGPERGKYRLATADTSFALDASRLALLAPYMASASYWDDRFGQLLEWQYLDAQRTGQLIDVDTTRLVMGHYSPLRFLSYRFQPSMEWPVVFDLLTNNHQPQTLTLAALNRLAEWGAFATDNDMLWQEQHADALAADRATRRAEEERMIDSLDAIVQRTTRQADSLVAELEADSLEAVAEQMRRDVEAAKQRMRRDQIFIMNIKPAQSDYMFGLEFNFFNCFAKTITKVEITVLPCNKKGAVQTDKFGRSERTVRCMGPIRPDAPAQYTFDELFWDDSHRIAYLRTTSITLHFTDGTHRTFSGADKIRRHSLAN